MTTVTKKIARCLLMIASLRALLLISRFHGATAVDIPTDDRVVDAPHQSDDGAQPADSTKQPLQTSQTLIASVLGVEQPVEKLQYRHAGPALTLQQLEERARQPAPAELPGQTSGQASPTGLTHTAAGTPAASNDPSEDDSVRCRLGGICEGRSGCGERKGGEPNGSGSDAVREDLRCVSDDAGRASAVRRAATWAWKGYRDCAWGQDELAPLSCNGSAWFDLGLTLVDSLDTLLIMGLWEEFDEATEWVAHNMTVARDRDVNLFETTIRVLGGLLSAHHLSAPEGSQPGLLQSGGAAHVTGDESIHPSRHLLFLERAVELGARLFPAMNSKSGIPLSDVNLATGATRMPKWGHVSSLSEVSSLSVEFTSLARLTNQKVFEDMPRRVFEQLAGLPSNHSGLLPLFINPVTGRVASKIYSFGARGDSHYEYMLKQWLLTGKSDALALQRYKLAIGSLRCRLLHRTGHSGLLFVGEVDAGKDVLKMDHLVCFLPGLLALGHFHGVSTVPDEPCAAPGSQLPDLVLAEELARTCYELYRRMPAGLAPEIVRFSNDSAEYPQHHAHDVGGGDFRVQPADAHNLLRPETVESLYVLWKVTGDQRYKEQAWTIFRAFEKFARVETGGYASLDSVLSVPPNQRDKMESFWISETLKYLFLMFAEGRCLRFDGGRDSTHDQLDRRRSSHAVPAGLEEVGHVGQQTADGGQQQTAGGGQPQTAEASGQLSGEGSHRRNMHAAGEERGRVHGAEQGRDCVQVRSFPLDSWVFNTEAHPLPVVGPASASRVRPIKLDYDAIFARLPPPKQDPPAQAGTLTQEQAATDSVGDSSDSAADAPDADSSPVQPVEADVEPSAQIDGTDAFAAGAGGTLETSDLLAAAGSADGVEAVRVSDGSSDAVKDEL